MTTLDMDALTERQRFILGQIAIGFDGGHHPQMLRFLAERGLIVGRTVRMGGTPAVDVTRWEVPLDVHIQWAAWCAQQPDEEGE